MPKYAIDEFVASKEKWIIKNLTKSRQQKNMREDFDLNYGDTVYFMSEPYIITGNDELSGLYPFGDNNELYIPSGMAPEQIKHACMKIYRETALDYLVTRTNEFAKLMSAAVCNVKINNAKSRWGSCSADRNISYSWRLIMADEDTVDYVIVHELAHITEMNHSKRFWAIVERFIPDYKKCKKRLKELQAKLTCENWD